MFCLLLVSNFILNILVPSFILRHLSLHKNLIEFRKAMTKKNRYTRGIKYY